MTLYGACAFSCSCILFPSVVIFSTFIYYHMKKNISESYKNRPIFGKEREQEFLQFLLSKIVFFLQHSHFPYTQDILQKTISSKPAHSRFHFPHMAGAQPKNQTISDNQRIFHRRLIFFCIFQCLDNTETKERVANMPELLNSLVINFGIAD